MTRPDPPSEPTDEELVARVCAGERHLFELIMRRHKRRIYRAARAIVRDDAEAEDVMQGAYVRAYEHLPEFGRRAQLSTQPPPGPEERASDAETRRLLEEAIDELPEDVRVVFVLRAVEEMSGARGGPPSARA